MLTIFWKKLHHSFFIDHSVLLNTIFLSLKLFQKLIIRAHPVHFWRYNPFQVNIPFLYPLKNQLLFPEVFNVHKNGKLTWNELMWIILKILSNYFFNLPSFDNLHSIICSHWNIWLFRLHIMAGQYPENVEKTSEVRESYKETYISNMKYASSRLELVSYFSIKCIYVVYL